MSKLLDAKDRDGWLKNRASRITASDVAAAMGVSPYKSRLALYAEKIGEMPGPDENDSMAWGRLLQSGIGARFAEVTGRDVQEFPAYSLLVHDSLDWLACSPDFYESDREKGLGVLETKATGYQWTEDAPLHYQVQLQAQLFVTGRAYGTLCAFQGLKNPPAWADYDVHPEFQKRMVSQLEEFQWRVTHRKPPAVDDEAVESAREALAALFPKDSGAEVALPPEALEWATELEQLKGTVKALSEQITARENKVKELIGGATFGVLVDGRRYSWKEQVTVTPPQPEKVKRYRVLRLLKGGN